MNVFGYRAHRTAVCEGCGTRLPTEAEPAIVWGHSRDGQTYAAYCEACAARLQVPVVARVVPGADPSGSASDRAEVAHDPADAVGDPGRPSPAPGSEDDVVALSEPRLRGPLSVEEALARRRSVREFADAPMTVDQLSQLLWSAQGTTEPTYGLRAAPSAGALYPLEVYAVIERIVGLRTGVYRYVQQRHSLELVLARSVGKQLCTDALWQTAVSDAPVTLAFAGVFGRTTTKYGERGRRYVHMEAGHAAQNVSLQAVALGLGTVVIAAFDDGSVQRTLDIRDDEEPLYLVPVGMAPSR